MFNVCIRSLSVVLLLLPVACTTTAPPETHSTQPAAGTAAASSVTALFSPTSVTGESIRDETIRRIDQTQRTLDLAMYGFTEPTLSAALIRAKARGVSLRVILDSLQAGGAGSQSDELRNAGITVKLMRGIKANGIMHHKVAIYDGRAVQTGSFNWTDNASCCSWENAVFLSDQKLVDRFQKEFDRMWTR
jgi:phosphatidylserine/phosphatidylglycerophosphate/cardiolipin synthase-like enzyme